MSEYFVQNNKFCSLNGILGRRDFIVNCLIIDILELVFSVTPVIFISFLKPEFISVFSGTSRPLWISLCFILVGLISCGLYFPSIVRRVRDILGEEDDNKIFLISSIICVVLFFAYTPIGMMGFGRLLGLFVLLSLVFKNGKITGEKPKSEIVKFNWGAFFGTWIWGLFNKTPITLLMIPLSFTPAFLPFMVICGLKGNEWAYENNKDKYDTVEKLHLTQSVQSIFLTIFSPIITLALFIGISIVSGSALYGYSQKHPEIITKMEMMLSQYQVKAVETTFDKIEYDGDIYKFYLDPEDWSAASGTLKSSVLKNAQSYLLIKNNKKYLKFADLVDSVEILNKVKIYSTFNNEVLGEFYLSDETVEKVKSALKQNKSTEVNEIWNSGYKLNNHPSLP